MAKLSGRLAAAKPYVYGLVVGLIAAPVFGLWYGSLVTSGTRDAQVRQANVDALAQICVQLAREHRLRSGDTSEITGYRGRTARNELAAKFAVMPGEDEADSAVRRACADRLAIPEV